MTRSNTVKKSTSGAFCRRRTLLNDASSDLNECVMGGFAILGEVGSKDQRSNHDQTNQVLDIFLSIFVFTVTHLDDE